MEIRGGYRLSWRRSLHYRRRSLHYISNEIRGGYRLRSLVKQNKKAKICAVFCFAGKRKLSFLYL
jgi:hypothetical protein